MKDYIANTFGIAPMVINEEKNEVVPYERKEAEDVFYEIDETLKNTSDISKEVIQQLLDLAQKSQHPRAYEVLVQAIKQQTEAGKTRWDMHKEKIEAQKPTQPQTVHNTAIFTGSTKDVLEQIKGKEEDG